MLHIFHNGVGNFLAKFFPHRLSPCQIGISYFIVRFLEIMTTVMGEFQAFHTYIRFRIGVVVGEADFLMDGACQW